MAVSGNFFGSVEFILDSTNILINAQKPRICWLLNLDLNNALLIMKSKMAQSFLDTKVMINREFIQLAKSSTR